MSSRACPETTVMVPERHSTVTSRWDPLHDGNPTCNHRHFKMTQNSMGYANGWTYAVQLWQCRCGHNEVRRAKDVYIGERND